MLPCRQWLLARSALPLAPVARMRYVSRGFKSNISPPVDVHGSLQILVYKAQLVSKNDDWLRLEICAVLQMCQFHHPVIIHGNCNLVHKPMIQMHHCVERV